MSKIDIIFLDNSIHPKEEINIKKPKTYQELLRKLRQKFENLPENYEIFYLNKENKEIKINNEEDYKMISDILFIRELDKNILEQSLYEKNYNKLSESKQEILDEKYNCILCSIIIKNEKPFLCYKCQKIFHEKCLKDWDKECKLQHKILECPNCRNELAIEKWNKKLDNEEDRKLIADLINKINENELSNNMLTIKDKKINELKEKIDIHNELIKKYEKYIEKTIKIFQNILNKLNSIHSSLKLENNKKLNNLINHFTLNLDNLDIYYISTVIYDELDKFKVHIIKNNKEDKKENYAISNQLSEKLNNINNNPFLRKYTNNGNDEEYFSNKSKTFSLFDNNIESLFDKNNNIINIINKKGDTSVDNKKNNLFYDDKGNHLFNEIKKDVKPNKLLEKEKKDNHIINPKEEDISFDLESDNISKYEDKNGKNNEINKDNNNSFVNMQNRNIDLEKKESDYILSDYEIEYSIEYLKEKKIPKQKPLNRKIYSNLIKKMINIINKKKKEINVPEKIKVNSLDKNLNKLLSDFEEKIVSLKKCYIDTLVKKHFEKSENNKKKIIFEANLPKRRNELKKIFLEIIESTNHKLEKDNLKYYYTMISNLLDKYLKIEDEEIINSLNNIKKPKVIEQAKGDKDKEIKKNQIQHKKECNCFICKLFLFLFPLVFVAYFNYSFIIINYFNNLCNY